jgi:hypothetical protein
MKSTKVLVWLAAAALGLCAAPPALAQGAAVSVPYKTPTPKPTPTPDPYVHLACPAVNLLHDVQGAQNWTVRAVHANSVASSEVRREVGAHSDRLWCGYQAAHPDDGSVRTKAYAVLEAPADHPKCTVDDAKKAFACRKLNPGETY